MPTSVKIAAILVARPGKADELKALLHGMVAPSRAEAGNLRWDIWQDQADPNRFVLDELYKDNAAVAAHRDTLHFKVCGKDQRARRTQRICARSRRSG